MSHCPQCGEPTPEGARACPFCGSLLATAPKAPPPASRTIVGVSAREVAARLPQTPGQVSALVPASPLPVAAPAGAPGKASRTIVGMPATALGAVMPGGSKPSGPASGTAIQGGQGARPAGVAGARPAVAGHTIVGMAAGALGNDAPPGGTAPPEPGALPAPMAGAPRAQPSATLLGVARPGIAPLAPGELDDNPAGDEEVAEPARGAAVPQSPGYEPAGELGATIGSAAMDEAMVERVRAHD